MASKYQIRADNEVLADLTHAEYAYYNGKLKKGINIAGSLAFSLMPNNPVINSVKPLKSTITLRRHGKTIWAGRVVKSKKNIYNQYDITCEGALSWLYDVVIPPIGFTDAETSNIITSLINSYNGLCSPNRVFEIGVIEGEDIITLPKQNGYAKVFDLLSNIIKINGGFFDLDYRQDGTPILNYYKGGIPTAKEVRFGENLLDINEHIDTTKIITALYATGEGVSLPSPAYIENEKAVESYGRIFGSIHFDNIANQESLINQANVYLQQNMLGDVSLKIKAVSVDWEAQEGEIVRIISKPNGVDTNMIISEVVTDINNESSGYFTTGSSTKTLTKSIVLNSK